MITIFRNAHCEEVLIVNLEDKYLINYHQCYMTVLGHINLGAQWCKTMPSYLYDRSRPYKLALSMKLNCPATHSNITINFI